MNTYDQWRVIDTTLQRRHRVCINNYRQPQYRPHTHTHTNKISSFRSTRAARGSKHYSAPCILFHRIKM